ncbi:hypothetical protein BUZ00_03090 [Staphylococcus gallinarum]|uniref:hypothetical protein n=1 Tax=Staphylococcus gallinarum TaxID=1293 RepID=UPI000D1C92C7|nr:hypothetical protein [Staphylococcus gallinarum]PTE37223.1 hypothetical protein BUZ00_03090 [Staphylococcus gallinarum]
MKIKTKKQLNLPQLIEYAWENRIKGETFYARKTGMENVYFNALGRAEFSDVHQFSLDDYFTVEVEEDVTEDTVLPRILVKTNYDNTAKEFENSMINEFVPKHTKEIYIVNDDLTMTLIWAPDKGLVE